LLWLGSAYLDSGRYTDAIASFETLLSLAQGRNQPIFQRWGLSGLGFANFQLADYPVAQGHFEQALQLSKDIGDRRSEFEFLMLLVEVHQAQNNLEQAESYATQAEAVRSAIEADTGDGPSTDAGE
ncbi:MAG: tetratricopeptide repeat protein, partial [Cyanobacteria bacterium J06642_11]